MNTDRSISSENSAKLIDMINFERRQRQFLNELAMKRNQVEDLKKELDAANLKIHELTRALDTAKNTNEDNQYHLNLALTNARFFEDQLQSKRDFLTKNRLQQESAAAERENLRRLLQKSELQNFSLVQELNELKAQHSCDVAYQKELMNEDSKIRAKIDQVTKAFQDFQIDQNELIKLSNKIDNNEVMQKAATFYQQELHKYKQNYGKLEEKFIVANAAMEKFQKLSSDELFHPNQEIELIMFEWKKATEWFNDQKILQDEIIEKLTGSLKEEKESNIKFCIHESELEEELGGLKEKLNGFIKDHKDQAVQTDDETNREDITLIKTEVVEILEDN